MATHVRILDTVSDRVMEDARATAASAISAAVNNGPFVKFGSAGYEPTSASGDLVAAVALKATATSYTPTSTTIDAGERFVAVKGLVKILVSADCFISAPSVGDQLMAASQGRLQTLAGAGVSVGRVLSTISANVEPAAGAGATATLYEIEVYLPATA